MGNDGGSIPSRRELVKEAQRNPTSSELKESQKEHLAHRWSICPLSHTALHRPVVSDCTGLLYNKVAVLQYLLPAESSPLNKEDCDKLLQGRIKGLKDVVEVLFETNSSASTDRESWICPITSKELGAAVKSVYLIPCGHAFSQEAIKEIRAEECPQCNHAYEADNIIPLLPCTEEEKDLLKKRSDALDAKGLTHSLKKHVLPSKKRKANKTTTEDEMTTNVSNSKPGEAGAGPTQTPSIPISTPTPKFDKPPISSSSIPPEPIIASQHKPTTARSRNSNIIKHAATASLTARVLEEEHERKKRRTLLQNGTENQNINSLFKDPNSESARKKAIDVDNAGKKKPRDGDFMTRGFSIR